MGAEDELGKEYLIHRLPVDAKIKRREGDAVTTHREVAGAIDVHLSQSPEEKLDEINRKRKNIEKIFKQMHTDAEVTCEVIYPRSTGKNEVVEDDS